MERIAIAFEEIALTGHKFFDKLYPVRTELRDALVTHRQTEEEKLREDQGASEETDEEWVGPRERQYEEAQARRREQAQRRRASAAGGIQGTTGKRS